MSNASSTTDIYPLSLHDALPILLKGIDDRELARSYGGAEIRVPTELLPELPEGEFYWHQLEGLEVFTVDGECLGDRKSTRLNSSQVRISYAVFCLKKKKTTRSDT